MNDDFKVGDLIYDAQIYDGMNTDDSDLHFYKHWLPRNDGAKILELCCGTGRLTIPIAKEGFNITGVDIMPTMLLEAQKKADTAGLEVPLIQADVRALDLSTSFDMIFIPFNSIHHLYSNEDLWRTLDVVKNHLKPDGLFLLDCFNPNLAYIAENEKKKQQIASYTTEDGRSIKIDQTMRYNSKTQINRIEWHYFINGAFDSIQNLDMRMYFPLELDAYLKWSGFKILHKYGSFERVSFEDDSDKQIYVCKLANEK